MYILIMSDQIRVWVMEIETISIAINVARQNGFFLLPTEKNVFEFLMTSFVFYEFISGSFLIFFGP